MVKADFDYWSNGGQCQFSYSKFEKQFWQNSKKSNHQTWTHLLSPQTKMYLDGGWTLKVQ
jgi:hypothetical protein